MNKSPCNGCAERCMGCHGSCEAYKAYDEENKRRRAAAFAEQQIGQYNADREAHNGKMRERLKRKNGRNM